MISMIILILIVVSVDDILGHLNAKVVVVRTYISLSLSFLGGAICGGRVES